MNAIRKGGGCRGGRVYREKGVEGQGRGLGLRL